MTGCVGEVQKQRASYKKKRGILKKKKKEQKLRSSKTQQMKERNMKPRLWKGGREPRAAQKPYLKSPPIYLRPGVPRASPEPPGKQDPTLVYLGRKLLDGREKYDTQKKDTKKLFILFRGEDLCVFHYLDREVELQFCLIFKTGREEERGGGGRRRGKENNKTLHYVVIGRVI